MSAIHPEFMASGVQRGMDESPVSSIADGAGRALALLEEALALLDAAGLTLAAAELDHVRHLLEGEMRTR